MTTLKELGEILIATEDKGSVIETRGLAQGCVWRNKIGVEPFDIFSFDYRIKTLPDITYYRATCDEYGISTAQSDKPFAKWVAHGKTVHLHDYHVDIAIET